MLGGSIIVSMLVEIVLRSMQEAFDNVNKFMASNSTSRNLFYKKVQDRCEENVMKAFIIIIKIF